MNFTFSRNVSLAVFAAFLLGGGLFLANRQQHEPLPQKPAATGNEAVAAEDPGRDPNGGDPGRRAAPTGPGRESTVEKAKRANVFGLSGVVQLADVPEGRFRNELSRLSETARRHALEQLGELLIPLNDVASLSVDRDGWLFYQCHPRLSPPPVASLSEPNEALAGLPGAPGIIEAAAEVPINAPPLRHSRPGATKVIYLDFNGHSISGSAWNNEKGTPGDENYRPAVATYEAKPFNADGNPNSFSDAEQAVILRVWERVAEDYRGFDVDVTTEEPATFNANTGRILITDNVDANGVNMPSSTGSGVAYIDVFGRANYATYYSPALVYANQDYNYASYIAETASHEMGHNLSLSHDGTNSGDEYYDGHGTGETSWNAIMGGSFTENVTQWSKGEYHNANNLEDDLAIIAGHLGYVPDDHADSNGSATPLAVSGLSVSGAGVISQTGEADRFSFESGAGAITLSATTFRSVSQSYGGNLDVALELYDTVGSLVASANVDGVTNATLDTTVSGGTYYLRVFGAGSGTPLNNPPSGYTNYGSLGQYTISGTIVSTAPVAPSITSQPASVTVYAGQSAQFTVAASGYPAPSFQWKKGGVDIGGATGSSYAIANVTVGDAGNYAVVATNSAGFAKSNDATLNVAIRPTFTVRPTSKVVAEGQPVSFAVAATGGEPLTYEWRHNRTVIAGATSTVLNIGAATVSDRGYYEVIVTNSGGEVTSTVFYLSVAMLNPVFRVWGDYPSTPPTDLESVAGVALSSMRFAVAVKGDGTAVTWGTSSSGQTDIPANLNGIVAVAAGNSHVLALKDDGTVVGWGDNTLGQAAPPAGLSGVVAIAAGQYHSLALKSDGTLVAWGYSEYGQSEIPAGLKNVVAIQTGRFRCLALRSNGTVVQWGYDFGSAAGVPADLSDVALIAGGETHALALKRDGTVAAWGWDYAGSTVVPAGLSGVVGVAAGGDYGLALKSDGNVVGWGRNYQNQATPPAGLSGVVSIAAGGWTSLAVLRATSPVITAQPSSQTAVAGDYVALTVGANGTIPLAYQWRLNGVNITDGSDFSGSNTPTLTIAEAQTANAGSYDVVVSNASGSAPSSAATLTVKTPPLFVHRPLSKFATVGRSVTFDATATDPGAITYQWKHNGQVISGATGPTFTLPAAVTADRGFYEVTASNAVAGNHSFFSLSVVSGDTTNLTVAPWGDGGYGAIGPSAIPPGLNHVVAVAAGRYHAAALKSDGTIRAWGLSNFGSTSVPSGLSDVVGIAAGEYHTLALRANGRVLSWGSSGDSPPPVPPGLTNVVAIAAKGSTNVALKSDGTVVTWGTSSAPAGLTGVVEIAAGAGHALALKADGTVVAWGGNYDGETNVPAGLAGVIAVAAGEDHSLVLKSDGTVVAWGRNDVGQATVPIGLNNVIFLAGGFVHSVALKGDGTVKGWGRDNEGEATSPVGLPSIAAVSSGSYYNLVLIPIATPDAAPAVVTQPQNQTVPAGSPATFAVTVSGSPEPAYQWKKNGANIAGATGSSYTVASVLVGDVGSYTVVVTNSVGSATSNNATLAISVTGAGGVLPAGFDAAGYLARYPEVAAVFGTNYSAAWVYYHDYGIYQGEVFDDLFRVDEYLALYPELFAIFGSDLGAALDHWLGTGRIEGKLGRIPLEFSAAGYFTRNPDVATAVNNDPILAWGHYWLYGIYEGRAYDDELRVFEYLAINADLTSAFVNDWRTAALHWMRYGRTEGRLGRLPLTFSVSTYLSRNPDVAAVWGTDPTTVFLHFWLYGVNEARTYDDLFRVDDYLALNSDVAATFGTDRRGAFKHWVRYGQSEGRPAKNP